VRGSPRFDDVFLAFGNLDVKLSDNYFDVLPGETITIKAATTASLEELKAQLKAISLTDAFKNE
jgi:beta-mannosidase